MHIQETASLTRTAKKLAPVLRADDNGSPLSQEETIKAYHRMVLLRRFEEKAGQLYGWA